MMGPMFFRITKKTLSYEYNSVIKKLTENFERSKHVNIGIIFFRVKKNSIKFVKKKKSCQDNF